MQRQLSYNTPGSEDEMSVSKPYSVIDRIQREAPDFGPLIMHFSSRVGRTVTFIAIYITMCRLDETFLCMDRVFAVVFDLRLQMVSLLQATITHMHFSFEANNELHHSN